MKSLSQLFNLESFYNNYIKRIQFTLFLFQFYVCLKVGEYIDKNLIRAYCQKLYFTLKGLYFFHIP